MSDVVYIYGIVTLAMSILTVLWNTMIILAFYKEQNLRSRPSNLLILAIATSDLIYGLNLFVYYGFSFIGHPYGEIGCMISVFTEYAYVISNTFLVTISLDRLLLVSVPYSKYSAWQSKTRIKIQIGIVCVLGLIAAIVELSLWNYSKKVSPIAASIDFDLYCLYPARRMQSYGLVVSLGYLCMPVVLVTILSSIFFALLKIRISKSNQIGTSTASTVPSTGTTQGGEDQDQDQDGGHRKSVRKRYLKPAITLAALITAMGFSSLPYCIYLIVVSARPSLNSFEVIYIMLLIAQMNPLLNPLFYGATQRSIQDFYKRAFVKLFRR